MQQVASCDETGLISEQGQKRWGGVFWGAVSEPGRRGVCAMSPRDAVPTILSKTEYLEDGCMHPGCRQLTAKDHLIIYSSYFRLEVDNMCMSPTQCSY